MCLCAQSGTSAYVTMWMYMYISLCMHVIVVMSNYDSVVIFHGFTSVGWWQTVGAVLHGLFLNACVYECIRRFNLWHLSPPFFSSQRGDSRAWGGYTLSSPPLTGTGFWQALCRVARNFKTPLSQSPAVSWAAIVATVTHSGKKCVLWWRWKNSSCFRDMVGSIVCDVDGWPWVKIKNTPNPLHTHTHTHTHTHMHAWIMHTILDAHNPVLVRAKPSHIHTCMHR